MIIAIASSASVLSQGRFGGYMFGDYFYNVSRDSSIASLSNTANGGAKAFQAFQFRRIYLTYDDDISDQFSARLRFEADQAALFSNSTLGTFVKDAYLRWKNIFAGSDFYFGIQPTPAYEVSEGLWGYRSLEKTIMDLRGIVSSRDFGIALKGKLGNDGLVHYWLLVANGNAQRPENDKYKRFYAHIQVKPSGSLQATAYFDYADRADVVNPYNPGTKVGNAMTTVAGFVSYNEQDAFTIGCEAFLQSTANGYNNSTSLVSRNAMGVSLFGSANLQPDVALVGRYDYFDPNTDGNSKGDIRNYVIAGVSWKPNKNVSVIPNILYETYESAPGGPSIDPSLTARMTFYFIFL